MFVCVVHGRDCLDLLHKGYTEDGIYGISPDGNKSISVVCDQKTNGGGWTVFQRRLDGSVDFCRDWNNYKNGFGEFTSEFWLGNDNIHTITSQGSELLIELQDHENLTAHVYYHSFQVGSEAEKYVLHFTEFSGTAGDSMSGQQDGMMFSTKDQDNSGESCAQSFTGAWWYNKCQWSNLNGRYGDNTYAKGVNWKDWRGYYYSLKESAMKVKPRRGKI